MINHNHPPILITIYLRHAKRLLMYCNQVGLHCNKGSGSISLHMANAGTVTFWCQRLRSMHTSVAYIAKNIAASRQPASLPLTTQSEKTCVIPPGSMPFPGNGGSMCYLIRWHPLVLWVGPVPPAGTPAAARPHVGFRRAAPAQTRANHRSFLKAGGANKTGDCLGFRV